MSSKNRDLEDSISLQKPRTRGAMSVPGIMTLFQNEWDSTVLQISDLKKQLENAHKELIEALYQNEASIRVVARLTKERDESLNTLQNLHISDLPKKTPPRDFNFDILANAEISAKVLLNITEKQRALRNIRKVRKIPDTWPTPAVFSSYSPGFVFGKPAIEHRPATSSLVQFSSTPLFAAGRNNGSISLFNLSEINSSSPPSVTLTEHTLDITQLAFSNSVNKPFLLSASLDQTLRLWPSNTLEVHFNPENKNEQKHEVEKNNSFLLPCNGLTKGAVLSTSVHPCDLYSLSTTADGNFFIHDLTTAVPIVARTPPIASTANTINRLIRQPLTHCAFHPDGMLFCTCTADGFVTLYDVSSLKSIITFNILSQPLSSYATTPSTSTIPLYPITSIKYSEDGRHLAISDSYTVNLIDLITVANSNYQRISATELFFPGSSSTPSPSSSTPSSLSSSSVSPILSVSYDWSGKYLASCGRESISVINTKNLNVLANYSMVPVDSAPFSFPVFTNCILTYDAKTVVGSLSNGMFIKFSGENRNKKEKELEKEVE